MVRFSSLVASLQLATLSMLIFPGLLSSQTISYLPPDEFSVCGNGNFEITIENNTAASLNDVLLTLDFTTSSGANCGMAYLPGSISGAAENDISNLGTPIFQVQNLAAGETATLNLQATAPCLLAACIDDGEFFVNEISLSWSSGSTSITTDPYIVERPLLVITSITGTVLSGERGDVLTRTYTITNTRPGPLESFVFTDVFQAGIEITADVGTDISAAPNTFQLLIDGGDFTTVGDGDALFELNESITVTEQILVTDCGTSLGSSASSITVGWDCDGTAGPGEACQQAPAAAIVQFEPFSKLPDLTFEPFTTLPECNCGPAYRQGLTITNNGDAFAENIILDISTAVGSQPGFTAPSFLDPASIALDSTGAALQNFATSIIGPVDTPSCDFVVAVADSMLVTLLQLGPGESMVLSWDVLYCSMGCKQPQVFWQYRYEYGRECYPGIFAEQENYIDVIELGESISSSLSSNAFIESLYQDDSTYVFHFELNYDSLNIIDDQLEIELEIPCGFIWDDTNEMLLDGQAPTSINLQPGNASLMVTANYLLPLSSQTAGLDFEVTFECDSLCDIPCLTLVETSCPWSLGVPDSTDLTRLVSANARIFKCPDLPASCNLCTNASEFYLTDCGPFPTCPVQAPGYVHFTFDAARKNFGLPDTDDDHLPGPGNTFDPTLIRSDRLMTGDTLHAEYRGAVVVDIPGAEFPIAYAEFYFNPPQVSDLGMTNQAGMINPTGLPIAGASGRVFDSSTGQWYDCPMVLGEILGAAGSRLGYEFDFSVGSMTDCGLPSDFLFAEGDSIHLDVDFRIAYNIQRDLAPDTDPLSTPIIIEPRMIVEIVPDSLPVDCYCFLDPIIEITGYEYTLANGNLALPLCETSNYAGGSQLRVLLNEGNFFPYEYRPLALAEEFKVTLPPEISLAETRLTLLRYQGEFTNIAGPEILTPNLSGETYIFDLEQYQMGFLDEGYQALIQYRFDTDCALADIQSLELCTTFDFADELPEIQDPLNFTQSFDVLNPLDPKLEFSTLLPPMLVLPSDQLIFDFEMENQETTVGSQSSGPAPNTWVFVNAPALSNLQLLNVTTGEFLPLANGLFQVGDLPIGTTDFQLLATNNSCETIEVELRFGWNCEAYNSILQEACVTETHLFTILSPPGELDFFVESPTTCSDLCDTIGYHSLEIFNAELGAVYGLVLTAQMPPGFDVLTGSTAVEWPTGSGNIYPLNDPENLGGGVFEWNISELFDTLSTGLSSVTSAPQNSLTIRFLGETTCDFIAGAFGLFTISGQQNCGLPANTVAKPGEAICINGVSQPYSTSIGVEAAPGFACNDEVDFTLTLSASEDWPLGACVIVNLPPGIDFVSGSCNSDCQASFNCLPTVNGSTLTWQLPEGTPQSEEICFNFSTSNWSALNCGTGNLLVQTANETQALCAITGDLCSVKVNTGSLIFPYQIERPDFSLENFTATASPSGANDLINYSIDVTNNGLENDPPFFLDFLLDTDGNGSGDLLVTTENFPLTIPNGVIETLSGSFEIPSGNLCGLIAAVATNQCLCAPHSIAVSVPIIYETGISEVVCSGEILPIGVSAQPGFSYQWLPTDCLDSGTSAMTVFSCENDGTEPVNYPFTLIATEGICAINYLLDVTVQPVPGIVFAASPICAGAETNIFASAGVSYEWSGPGVVQNIQNQVVTPTTTSTYAVTITDEEGCTGADMATIEVVPSPSVNAGVDTTFCPGSAAQLNAIFETGFDYEWSPGPPVLSSSTSPNPQVLILENQTFTLTAFDPDSGCSAMDEVTVTFGDILQINLPPDLTICAGGSINLMASGATSYVWTPAGDCQDPPTCSNIIVSPSETTTYFVNGADAAGCEGTGNVTVTIVNDKVMTQGEPINLCDGETIILFDEVVSQSGEYCGTFQLGSGCDSTHCVEVTFAPPIPPSEIDTTICQGDSVNVQGEVFDETGVYPFTFASVDGCDSLVFLDLVVLDTPTVFLVDSNLPDNFVQLSVIPPVFDSILWFGGNITGDCTNQLVCEDLLIGEPNYSVTVFGDNGCPATGTVQPLVFPPCEPEDAEVPNVFTPNGDGVNDVFTIVTPGDEMVLRMRIWNRWGEKLYDGPGPWLGLQNGDPAPTDVYIYLMEVGCAAEVMKDEERQIKGDVTLLR